MAAFKPRLATRRRCLSAVHHTSAHRARDIKARNRIQDELLDYIQAGPKLRRWYGETDMMLLPQDGKPEPESDEDDNSERDAILVTDADTPMGELIVLQLVLSRERIRALVRDVSKSKTEFGPYVKAVSGDVGSGSALKAAMRSVRTVIIPGRIGSTLLAAKKLGVEHVVLLSSADQNKGLLGGLFKGADAALMDPAREAEVRACGLAHTILRFGPIQDRFGGNTYIEMTQDTNVPPGPIAREDAALVAVRALKFVPKDDQGLIFEVGGAGDGVPPSGDEWREMFGRLRPCAPVSA